MNLVGEPIKTIGEAMKLTGQPIDMLRVPAIWKGWPILLAGPPTNYLQPKNASN